MLSNQITILHAADRPPWIRDWQFRLLKLYIQTSQAKKIQTIWSGKHVHYWPKYVLLNTQCQFWHFHLYSITVLREKIYNEWRISHYKTLSKKYYSEISAQWYSIYFGDLAFLWLNNQADISIFQPMSCDIMTSCKISWGKNNLIKPLKISY